MIRSGTDRGGCLTCPSVTPIHVSASPTDGHIIHPGIPTFISDIHGVIPVIMVGDTVHTGTAITMVFMTAITTGVITVTMKAIIPTTARFIMGRGGLSRPTVLLRPTALPLITDAV